jgi:hypothetical protein
MFLRPPSATRQSTGRTDHLAFTPRISPPGPPHSGQTSERFNSFDLDVRTAFSDQGRQIDNMAMSLPAGAERTKPASRCSCSVRIGLVGLGGWAGTRLITQLRQGASISQRQVPICSPVMAVRDETTLSDL